MQNLYLCFLFNHVFLFIHCESILCQCIKITLVSTTRKIILYANAIYTSLFKKLNRIQNKNSTFSNDTTTTYKKIIIYHSLMAQFSAATHLIIVGALASSCANHQASFRP